MYHIIVYHQANTTHNSNGMPEKRVPWRGRWASRSTVHANKTTENMCDMNDRPCDANAGHHRNRPSHIGRVLAFSMLAKLYAIRKNAKSPIQIERKSTSKFMDAS